MFWKRKEKIEVGSLGPIYTTQNPTKKEFENMLEILREAEKFDSIGEYYLAEEQLQVLKRYIDKYAEL